MEHVLEKFRESVAQAAETKQPLRIRGGGSKDWYGQELQGKVLDTRDYAGIVSYDPTELVITACCGTRLADIEALLAQHNQMLAFEPPAFSPESTIGGVIASGLSGPRRQAVGSARDFVLGAAMMDGKGTVLHFGGQVMKNVAGYDVSRLLTGSLGTLGLILEVSLKVLPRPFREETLRLDVDKTQALALMNTWGGRPFPISATSWHDGQLAVRLSGSEPAIESAKKHIGGEIVPDATAYWQALRNQQFDFFSPEATSMNLWRLSVPTTAPALDISGSELIEWGGAQRWVLTSMDAAKVRAVADNAKGHATLYRTADKSAGVFHPLAKPIETIHRNLKNAFDPHGVFNPGRMYKGF